MKRVLLLSFLCLLFMGNLQAQSVIVGWYLRTAGSGGGATTGTENSGAIAAHPNTGINLSEQPTILFGPNLTNATTGNSRGAGANILGTVPTDYTEAYTSGTYYEIVLKPKVGAVINLASIGSRLRRMSANAPDTYVWTYSVNSNLNNNFVQLHSPVTISQYYTPPSSDPSNNGVIQNDVNVASETALQNLKNGDVVYLRMYYWASSAVASPLKTESLAFAKTVENTSNPTLFEVLNVKGITVLPVTLTSFKATRQSNSVRLNWVTASEQNNSYFTVLRAGNDKNFSPIGKVNSNGTTNVVKEYSLTDYKPLAGANYYKLSQTDLDGTTKEIGEVQHVQFDFSNTSLTIIQQTEQSIVKAILNAAKADKANITIYNVSGNALYQTQLNINSGVNEILAPVNLNKGVYILKVKTQLGETWQAKFVK